MPSVTDSQRRRLLLVSGAASVAGLSAGSVQARLSDWLPYRADQIMRMTSGGTTGASL